MYASPAHGQGSSSGGGKAAAATRARRTTAGASSSARLQHHRVSGSPAGFVRGLGSSSQRQQQQQQQQQAQGQAQAHETAALLSPGTRLLQDGINTVTVASVLPLDVRRELAQADPYADPLAGFLEPGAQYAILVTRKAILVWNHLARGTLPPTCFRLTLPPSPSRTDALHLVALVPSPSRREPGLIVVLPQGAISFIESVAAAEQVDEGQQLQLTLVPNESVAVLKRYGMHSFALATSHSRLFRLTIVLQDGRRVAQISPFLHSKGLLGRLFGSSSTYGLSSEPILSLALGHGQAQGQGQGQAPGSQVLYALSPTSVQRWNLVEGGADTLVVEQDIRSLIVGALQQNRAPSEGLDLNMASITLLDAAVAANGALAVLFAERYGSAAPSSAGLALLNVHPTTSALSVFHTQTLKGIFETDARSEFRPQLVIPGQGVAAFIISSSSLTTCLLQTGYEFQIVLKNQSKSRLFAVGALTQGSADTELAGVALLATSTPPLIAELDVVAAAQQDAAFSNAEDRGEVATVALQSFVRQAVLYGQQPLNPLAFILSASYEGDLALAAERLSDEFMGMDASEMAAVIDVRALLASRKDKLAALIAFIRQSGQLGALSSRTRRKLCADAELVEAAAACYVAQDSGLRSRAHINLLSGAVEQVLQARELVSSEDVIRTFFRRYLELLPDVFGRLVATLSTAPSDVGARTALLLEINRLVLAAHVASARRRDQSASLYGLTAEPTAYEAWSFQATSLEQLEMLFNATDELIADRRRALGSSIDADYLDETSAEVEEAKQAQQELKTQLCDIADIALRAYQDRLSYLLADSSSSSLVAEREHLERRFHLVRPRMILPLVNIGREDKAFELAERHGDFNTLTKLCQEATGGPKLDKASLYVRKYGQAFAFELYDWHIAHAHIRDLFLLGEKAEQSDLVNTFLHDRSYPRLAWLQELRIGDEGGASVSLDETHKAEPDLRARRLMLSLAKLARAASFGPDRDRDMDRNRTRDGAREAVQALEEKRELVSAQLALLSKLKADVVKAPEGDVDAAVASVIVHSASRLEDYPALTAMFASIAKKLWAHQSLDHEELIDLYTLRDCLGDDVDAYGLALGVCARARDDLPAGRWRDSMRAVWRRVILRDDWDMLADTAGVDDETVKAQLRSTALYHVVKLTHGKPGLDAVQLELNSDTLTHAPTSDSLRGRFQDAASAIPIVGAPTHPAPQTEAQRLGELLKDLEAEAGAVGALLARHGPWLEQVCVLAQQEAAEEAAVEAAVETAVEEEEGEDGAVAHLQKLP